LKKTFSFAIKLGVTVLLLWYLFSKIEIENLLSALYASNPLYMVLAIVINSFGIVIGVSRWRMLLGVQKIYVPFKKLLSISLVSGFFGVFLPTGFSSDVVKGLDMFKYSGQGVSVTSSIMVERFFGFLSLLVIGGIARLIGYQWITELKVVVAILVVYFAMLSFVVLSFNRRFLGLLMRLNLRYPILSRVKKTVKKFVHSIRAYKGKTSVLVAAMIISLVLQFTGILYYYILSFSLSLNVAFWPFFAIMPIVWIVTTASFTVGGLGIKEGAFVLLLANLGVSTHQALLLSLLGTALYLPFAIIGAVIFITRKRLNEPRSEMRTLSSEELSL
jgi:uncharacterized protein (TIRG00374 family)